MIGFYVYQTGFLNSRNDRVSFWAVWLATINTVWPYDAALVTLLAIEANPMPR